MTVYSTGGCKMNKKAKKRVAFLTTIIMSTYILFSAFTVSAIPVQGGWVLSGGNWYYYTSTGVMAKNAWNKDSSGRWFYLGTDGAMAINAWAMDNSKRWFYLGADGAMIANGWAKDSSKCWFYLGSDGAMVASTWVVYKGSYYYLNKGGDMAFSTTTPDGYKVDASGARTTVSTVSELNDGLLHTGNFTLNGIGTFGPTSGTTTIVGNLVISNPNATAGETISLQNMIISGKLTIDYGEGNVILNNVEAKEALVSNVGPNSFNLYGDSLIGTLTINDSNGNARIFISGNGRITNTVANSGATLQVSSGANNSNPFGIVRLAPTSTKLITLRGSFDNVNGITNLNMELPYGSYISTFNSYAASNVIGTGNIGTAKIGVSPTTLQMTPGSIYLVSGVSAKVGGLTRNSSNTETIKAMPTLDKIGTPTSPVIDTNVKVTGITVSSTASTITTAGGQLQMTAAALPTNATNKNVTWSITSGQSNGTITSSGLLKAVNNGTVTVRATAADGSLKYGEKVITISNQQNPVITSTATFHENDVNPEFIVILYNDTFVANSTSKDNWIISSGIKNYTGMTITRNSGIELKIKITGVAVKGALNIESKAGYVTASGVKTNLLSIPVLAINKDQLFIEIKHANEFKGVAVVSIDGSDVPVGSSWVTLAEMNTYLDAIKAGQDVYDNPSATWDQINSATTTLGDATYTFDVSRKDGTKP